MIAEQDIMKFLDDKGLCLVDFLPIEEYEEEERYMREGEPSMRLEEPIVAKLERWKSNEELAGIVKDATHNCLDEEITDDLKQKMGLIHH